MITSIDERLASDFVLALSDLDDLPVLTDAIATMRELMQPPHKCNGFPAAGCGADARNHMLTFYFCDDCTRAILENVGHRNA